MEKNRISILGWMRQHIPAIVIAVLITTCALALILPPHFSTFAFQKQLQLLVIYLLGPTFFLISFLLIPLDSTVVIIVSAIAGLTIGLLFETACRHGATGKVLFIIAIIANTSCGYFLSVMSGAYVLEEPYTCEDYPSAELGIRADVHFVYEVRYGIQRHVFFMLSEDGGHNWQQFAYRNVGSDIQQCNSTRFLDAMTFYTWLDTVFYITHDGGKSWHEWVFNYFDPAFWELNFCAIADVQFQTDNDATMLLSCKKAGRDFDVHLTSSDGGLSWEQSAD